MGTRRFVYNKTLDAIKNEKHPVNFFSLRNKLVIAKNNPNVKEWELETPKDIRAGAIRDLVKNYKTAFSCLKNKQIKGFKVGYASKKDTPSIEIPKSSIKIKNGLFMYKTYIPNKIKLAPKQKLNISIDYDCRLQIKNNKWYLVVPMKVKAKTIEERKSFCSMDPGVKSFQTVYSEDIILKIKVRKVRLKKLQDKLDCFRSLRSKKIISNGRFKRRERHIYFKLNNLIDDLHHKTNSILTNTFEHIILPSFESQDMTKKNKIKGVNRDLLQLKHFLFKQRLISKCKLNKCTIDICTEEYTSKTCGYCGTIVDIKNKDVFSCLNCNLVIDRDVNGARNIAIKRLNETL